MKCIILPNPYCDKQFRCAVRTAEILRQSGAEVAAALPFGADRTAEAPESLHLTDLDSALAGCDVLICLGGDGTILHTSKLAASRGLPILGINIGTLGFMAELESADLEPLRELAAGKYRLEERMMLHAEVCADGRTVFSEDGLNDAVVSKGSVARELHMSVSCGSSNLLSFSGDGTIVATPTGSTAYSFSAGGPIVDPLTSSLVVTPICAHGQNANSFVLDGSRVLTMTVERSGRKSAFLSVDGGRAFRLEGGDTVTVTRSEKVTRLVRLHHRNFFDTVNKKFYNK